MEVHRMENFGFLELSTFVPSHKIVFPYDLFRGFLMKNSSYYENTSFYQYDDSK